MDTKWFVQRRKALGLTQTQLCQGICTQATLSKFERQGKTPSLGILEKLCTRLGTTIDGLSDADDRDQPLKDQLDSVECFLMQEELPQALKQLKAIDKDAVKAWPLKLDYYYLRALLAAMINKQPIEVMEDVLPILDDLDEHHQTIYARLAYAAMGICYQRHGTEKLSRFYFTKISDYLKDTTDEDTNSIAVPGEWKRRLTLYTLLAENRFSNKDYQGCLKAVNEAIQLSSSKNATYWLPRLKLLAARSAYQLKKPKWEISQLAEDALAFSRLNGNQTVNVQAAALRKQCQKMKSNQ